MVAEKSRTQWIIDKIMASPKLAKTNLFEEKIYRDEPLVMTGSQFGKMVPEKIREMRNLARISNSREKIFIDQGRFMADYRDDYVYPGEFMHYYPTYQDMTDAQLRGYFTWRTKVRDGRTEKTSLSFAFVYIYELLNQIGTASPEAGFQDLLDFWQVYRVQDDRISSYVEMWLRDYVIYHNLDRALLDRLPGADDDQAVEILLDHRSHPEGEVFAALNSLSSYDLEKSLFFRQNREEMQTVALRVFAAVTAYYQKKPKQNVHDKIFGRTTLVPYHLFKSAVFHYEPQTGDRDYEIRPHLKYYCRQGSWHCERFVWYGRGNRQIGAILKSVDFRMRLALDHKSSLQDGKTNKTLKKIIEKEIEAYFGEKRRNAPRRIDIDISKLRDIRETARSTRDRLLVEEGDGETENPPVQAAEALTAAESGEKENGEVNNGAGLDALEIRFLRCLLGGEPYDGFLKEKGLMPSLLAERINEKLLPILHDTALVYEDGRPAVLEDYREELKGMFAK